jgi:hypothetical protein
MMMPVLIPIKQVTISYERIIDDDANECILEMQTLTFVRHEQQVAIVRNHHIITIVYPQMVPNCPAQLCNDVRQCQRITNPQDELN